MNRLDAETLDAALHLLDRQVVDEDGLLVCNVDDLEISDPGDGSLAVTGLLVGGAALVPRFSGRAGRWLRSTWSRLGVEQEDRDVPRWIDLRTVGVLDSAVVLTAKREGLLGLQPPAGSGVTHRRIVDLLDLPVRSDDGTPLGVVLDVRLAPGSARYEVVELVVGRGRPGTLLGYDRGNLNGPWMVARIVKILHRHTGQLPWDRVVSVEWGEAVTVRGGLDPLQGS
ncbi:MAG: hypothetical protein ACJ72D_14340 [Marmoricola sp.]